MARTFLTAGTLVAALIIAACGGGGSASFCEVVGEGLVPLDEDGATDRWRAVEAAAPPFLESAAELLRVVSDQIARLGPDPEFSDVAALAVTTRVTTAHRSVSDEAEARCGLSSPEALALLAGAGRS